MAECNVIIALKDGCANHIQTADRDLLRLGGQTARYEGMADKHASAIGRERLGRKDRKIRILH